MKQFYTSLEDSGKHFLRFVPVILVIFLWGGCAPSDDVQTFRKNTKGEMVFSFHDYLNGDETHWKVYFRRDTISELYRNGNRIPGAEIINYRDFIYERIKDIVDLRKQDEHQVRVFRFDDNNLKMNLNQLKKNFKDTRREIRVKINKDLNEEMKKLSGELKKLKKDDVNIKLKTKKFKDGMEDYKSQFKKLKTDSGRTIILNIDEEFLEKELNDLLDDLKDITVDINIPDIEITLDESLNDLDIKLKDLDTELSNLSQFFGALKTEMVTDNLIEKEDEEVTLKLEKDKLYVNNKEVPDHLFKKYKEMYKKQTGKEFKEQQHFHLN